MMTDILADYREKRAAQVAAKEPAPAPGRVLDAVDRAEIARSADARKARDLVRSLRTHSLLEIAVKLAPVVSDLGVRHVLEAAIDKLRIATRVYLVEELKDPGREVGWMGAGNGILRVLPGRSEHELEMAKAWNGLLMLVNAITSVGLHKPHREHPIMLVADPEQS